MNNINREHPSRLVLICQNRTCRKLDSRQVLAAFLADSVFGVEIKGVGCLGQCGNGPMVLILPEQIWYWKVQPHEVAVIIKQHLRGNCPVLNMLYPKFL